MLDEGIAASTSTAMSSDAGAPASPPPFLPFSPLRLPAIPEAEGPAWVQTLGEEDGWGTQQAELEAAGALDPRWPRP